MQLRLVIIAALEGVPLPDMPQPRFSCHDPSSWIAMEEMSAGVLQELRWGDCATFGEDGAPTTTILTVRGWERPMHFKRKVYLVVYLAICWFSRVPFCDTLLMSFPCSPFTHNMACDVW